MASISLDSYTHPPPDLQLFKKQLSTSKFSNQSLNNLRIACISSSSASLMASLIMFYTYFAIHPSRKKFRHVLILILVISDFLKALAIIIFPVLTYLNPKEVGKKTIDFLGFFTAVAMEGGDIAILAFAINTCLIIFNPTKPGGLYIYRYYYYASTIILPLLLASLAFINGVGYVELDIWCYLPERPSWYRLGLSFGPRYVIMILILIIYFSVYFYITRQLRKMNKQRKSFNVQSNKKGRFNWSFKKFFEKTIIKDDNDASSQSFDINIQLQLENSQRLKSRYKVISRQIRVIFLYPTAYFFLWIFPVIGNSLRLNHLSIYGISAIIAFVNPFNAFIDTIVYMIRETPWRYTYSKVSLTSSSAPYAQIEDIPRWRYYMRKFPLYSLPAQIIDNFEKTHGMKSTVTIEPNTRIRNGTINSQAGPSEPPYYDVGNNTNDVYSDVKVNTIPFVLPTLNLNPNEFVNGYNDEDDEYEEDEIDFIDSKQRFQYSGGNHKRNNSNEASDNTFDATNLNKSNDDDDDDDKDDDMDFIDFLNQGPPVR